MKRVSFTNSCYPPLQENIIDQVLTPAPFDSIYSNKYSVHPAKFDEPSTTERAKRPVWNFESEQIQVTMLEEDRFAEVTKFIIQECLLYYSGGASDEDVELGNPWHFHNLLVELLKDSATFIATNTAIKATMAVLIMTTHNDTKFTGKKSKRLKITDTPLGNLMQLHGPVSSKCSRVLQVLGITSFNVVQFLMAYPAIPERRQHLAMVGLLKASSSWTGFMKIPCVLVRSKSREIKNALRDGDFRVIESISRLDWYEDEDQNQGYEDPRANLSLELSYFIYFTDERIQESWGKYEAYYSQFY